MIRRDGLSKFSVRKLAEACGLSHHAPYRHFENKDALLAAVSVRIIYDMYEYLRDQLALYPNEEPYLVLCKEGVRYLLGHPECRTVFHLQNLPENVRKVVRRECRIEENVQRFDRIVADYLTRCAVREKDRSAVTRMIQGILVGLIQNIRRSTIVMQGDVGDSVIYILTQQLGLQPNQGSEDET